MLPQSIDDLAHRLQVDARQLTMLAATANHRYRHRCVPKSNGRVRRLAEPDRELKVVQRRLLDRVLCDLPLHPAATAFHPGASVLANAQVHVGQDFVFSTDLVDFFPTITASRVTGLFVALGAGAELAQCLAELVCYKGRLAQGAPTSPAVANLIARKLDLRITGFCARRGWRYTRYADDLTISGHGRFGDRDREWIGRCAEDEGFAINRDKTRLARHHEAQIVTGISVNGECRLPRQQRKLLRAMLHQAERNPAADVERLRGRVGWLELVEGSSATSARYREVLHEVDALAVGAADIGANNQRCQAT